MKVRIFANILLSLTLNHCRSGTEVGNGAHPEGSQGTTTNAGTPDAETTGEAQSPTAPSSFPAGSGFSPYLIVACASPFAETADGTFTDAAEQPAFSVEASGGGDQLVTISASMQTLTIQHDPAGTSNYAIIALPESPHLTCGPISSKTISEGIVERSLLFSDQTELHWVRSATAVTRISLVKNGIQEIWNYRKEP